MPREATDRFRCGVAKSSSSVVASSSSSSSSDEEDCKQKTQIRQFSSAYNNEDSILPLIPQSLYHFRSPLPTPIPDLQASTFWTSVWPAFVFVWAWLWACPFWQQQEQPPVRHAHFESPDPRRAYSWHCADDSEWAWPGWALGACLAERQQECHPDERACSGSRRAWLLFEQQQLEYFFWKTACCKRRQISVNVWMPFFKY